MTAYYNEHDPYAAQWLRNLIDAGHIAPGVVDERSIRDVDPSELADYQQCHFFAGVGIWSLALRQAGWPDDRPVWTGSCPCQPFSAAGQQRGFDDDRHLWPAWHALIDQCRPAIVLGEQVASALQWLDLVQAGLEAAGYACGAVDLCAAGTGGAHIRQRLYFVGLADTDALRWAGASGSGPAQEQRTTERRGTGGLADTERDDRRANQPQRGQAGRATDGRDMQGAGDTAHAPLLGRHPVDWLYCRDDKWRPVEPGTFPLADADPGRVGRLRAYGNSLDAETATVFVEAVMQINP